jgi:formylmethanofuran dehydrogenase subunit E
MSMIESKVVEEAGFRFKVECDWCGVIIRRNNVKDSRGMCLKCYARMLSQHGQPGGPEAPTPRWASDR